MLSEKAAMNQSIQRAFVTCLFCYNLLMIMMAKVSNSALQFSAVGIDPPHSL